MLSMEITFSDWLRIEINNRGWTWNKLATRAHLSSGTIYNIRDGMRGVGEDSLKAIASALQVQVEVVYRAAGFLPPAPPENREKDEIIFLYDQLSPDDRAEIIELLRFKANRNKVGKIKSSRAKKAPARLASQDRRTNIEQKIQ